MMYQTLFEQLQTDPATLVLTANRRLARYLQARFEAFQTAQQKNHWNTPRILPLHTWIQQQWTLYETTGWQLLTASQTQALWLTLLQNYEEATTLSLTSPTATAQLAAEAWNVLCEWQMSWKTLKEVPSDEVQTFYQLCLRFHHQCQHHRWCSAHDLLNHLFEIPNALDPGCTHVHLLGFDEWTPRQTRLLQTWQQAGTLLHFSPTPHPDAQVLQIAFQDSEQELTRMAEWAQGLHLQNPNLRIGCIVPNLSTIRTQVENTFQRLFSQQAPHPLAWAQTLPYNISAGLPLASLPLIQTALLLLQWLHRPLQYFEWSFVSQSAYFCKNQAERSHFALLDAKWRRQNFSQITLEQWQDAASLTQTPSRPAGPLASPREWATFFSEWLKALNWPGARGLNTDEFQAYQNWQTVFQSFVDLQFLLPELSMATALQKLVHLSQEAIFQPTVSPQPIQIMGTLEAAGFELDAVWISQLHSNNWPTPPAPNPFLPLEWQKRLKMPHANAERELHYAKQVMTRMVQSAPRVILSYPEYNGDEPLAPSAFVHGETLTLEQLQSNTPALTNSPTLLHALFQTQQLEILEDANATPLQNGAHLPGGSQMLKAFAACPFQAFARYRLYAKKLARPEWGLHPLVRGLLTHAVLEQLWTQLKNQEQLLRYSSEALLDLLKTQMDLCFAKHAASLSAVPAFCLQLEKNRLCHLLTTLFTLEKERPYFEVQAIEQVCEFELEGLKLHLKMDRVDRLADGSTLVLDYKTGKTPAKPGLPTDLPEPQLPLYALSGLHQGLAWIQLIPGQVRYQGISAFECSIPGILPLPLSYKEYTFNDWGALTQAWQHTLNHYAEQMKSGVAWVKPRERATCDHCDLQAVCRIKHSLLGPTPN